MSTVKINKRRTLHQGGMWLTPPEILKMGNKLEMQYIHIINVYFSRYGDNSKNFMDGAALNVYSTYRVKYADQNNRIK